MRLARGAPAQSVCLLIAVQTGAVGVPAAVPTAAPANVTSCRVVPGAVARRGGSTQEVIQVSFSVDSAAAADVARFTVASRRGVFRDFTARGLFTRGSVIADRVLRADPAAQQQFYALGAGADVTCSLTDLHFVDGTTWSPKPPITVAACVVIPNPVARRGSIEELIRVSYAAEIGPPADVATFTVKCPSGDLTGFTARGNFSGGTVIADRIVAADPDAQQQFNALGSTVGCAVSYVHFVDGSSWSAPAR